MKNLQIPVFFACDDNYIPFLGVALSSMKENANKDYRYRIIVLNEGLKENNKKRISRLADHIFSIEYVDIGPKISMLRKDLSLRLRDYYSVTFSFASPLLFGIGISRWDIFGPRSVLPTA